MEEATDKLVRKQGALVTEVGVLQRDAAVKDELMANVTAKMDTDHQAAIKASACRRRALLTQASYIP